MHQSLHPNIMQRTEVNNNSKKKNLAHSAVIAVLEDHR